MSSSLTLVIEWHEAITSFNKVFLFMCLFYYYSSESFLGKISFIESTNSVKLQTALVIVYI